MIFPALFDCSILLCSKYSSYLKAGSDITFRNVENLIFLLRVMENVRDNLVLNITLLITNTESQINKA